MLGDGEAEVIHSCDGLEMGDVSNSVSSVVREVSVVGVIVAVQWCRRCRAGVKVIELLTADMLRAR